MKRVDCGRGYYALVSDEDYSLVSKYKWRTDGRYGISHKKVGDKYRTVLMHRLIANTPKGFLTDHINGNTLDNRRENLRICDRYENARNVGVPKTNKTGYKGVRYNSKCPKRPWFSIIKFRSKAIFLGNYSTKEEAAVAYNNAALTYHGEFAKLNTVNL